VISFLSNADAKAFQRQTVKRAAERQAVCNDGSPPFIIFMGSG
jgi:hypothetical protein